MKKLILILSCLAMLFSAYTFAKTIDMYDQPNPQAKKIGSVDSSAGIIPIFQPNNNQWLKIADPRNGNVGWIKTQDLSNGKEPMNVTVTQKVMDLGSGPYNFRLIQFNDPSKMTPEQQQAMVKQIEQQRQQLQNQVKTMVDQVSKEFNQVFSTFPIVMPVVIFPQENQPAKNAQPANNKTAAPAAASTAQPQTQSNGNNNGAAATPATQQGNSGAATTIEKK